MLFVVQMCALQVPAEMTGFMVTIELPSSDADAVAYMRNTLESEHHIYIVYDQMPMTLFTPPPPPPSSSPTPVAEPTHPPARSLLFFTRLSAQVYLEMSDFEQLGQLVPQLLAQHTSRD